MTKQEIRERAEGIVKVACNLQRNYGLPEANGAVEERVISLVRASLEESARAVCERCKEETPIRDADGDAFWHAPERFGSTWCDASPIHDLISALDKEESNDQG